MRLCAISFLLVMTVQACCVAGVTKLPPGDRKVLEDSSKFRQYLATTNLPVVIVALCADDAGRLAEPGQQWEATDLIQDLSLPTKRLIWAAVAGEYYVVHYERGGRGHSFHVLVATLTKGQEKPKVVWRGVGGHLKDYAAFVQAVQIGKLNDELDYAH